MRVLLLVASVATVAGAASCDDSGFPIDLQGKRYIGLSAGPANATTVQLCQQACCDQGLSCQVYQFSNSPSEPPDCWLGQASGIPDEDPNYTGRGRNFVPPPPAPVPPHSPYTVDDSVGLGLRWEGVGAISGGGATTKLLMDYEPKVASDILDYLFLPNVGLNLQMLKVEIGGDTDSTEGAEPSHMHAKGDENYNRGYEWWLMKEAKKRNPDIKLYGLPWGWAGWLDPSATPDKPAQNAFVDPYVTANYTLAWLLGAKRVHGLTIDYVGQWNERDAPAEYAAALRDLVYNSTELGNLTTVLNRLVHYPGTTDDMAKQGCADYQWNTTDGSRWVDEEGSIFDGRSARCLARCLNRNYISDCHTATFQWHLVSSFYDYLPWARCGVAIANQPWSGAYEITSPTWAMAHTSQFAPIGWRYAAHSYGVTMLEKGGSMVTRISPDRADFSIVIEKMSNANSYCARGSNPTSYGQDEDVKFVLKGAFLAAVTTGKRTLQVWRSNFTSADDININPPDDALFRKQTTPLPVGADGLVSIPVGANEVVTITTLLTGGKGQAKSPDATPFPLPFLQTFDDEVISAPPAIWYDQMGAWEIQPSPTGSGQVMRQVSPVWPACWGYSCSGPTSYFGPDGFTKGLTVSVQVRLEDEGAFTFGPDNHMIFEIATDGTWSAFDQTGKASFAQNQWHNISIYVGNSSATASVDGTVIATTTKNLPSQPFHIKAALSRYIYAAMDNFQLTATN